MEIPLEKIDVNWKVPVGVGTFGKVYHGTWLCTDVAIKQIRRGATVKESIEREAKIHSLLRSSSEYCNIYGNVYHEE